MQQPMARRCTRRQQRERVTGAIWYSCRFGRAGGNLACRGRYRRCELPDGVATLTLAVLYNCTGFSTPRIWRSRRVFMRATRRWRGNVQVFAWTDSTRCWRRRRVRSCRRRRCSRWPTVSRRGRCSCA